MGGKMPGQLFLHLERAMGPVGESTHRTRASALLYRKGERGSRKRRNVKVTLQLETLKTYFLSSFLLWC